MQTERRVPLDDVRLAGAIVAALTLLRIAGLFLTDLNLHGDEAQYWTWSRDLDFGYFSKPPMIAWLIAATTAACGDGEACVRLSSPLLHGASSLALYFVGRELYDARVGLWSAILHATLPAVSFSSFLISTDVPLLFFWSFALLAVVRLRGGGGIWWTVLLGASVGCGMLSKYAMLYFVGCLLLSAALDRRVRAAVLGRNGAVAALIAAVLFSPNVVWNLRNGWATVSHTADNADWEGPVFHPDHMLEFLGGQFALGGPLLFVGFVVAAALALGAKARAENRLLAVFSAPILVGIALQALASRAHANWAATLYPAAVVLVAAFFAEGRRRWVRRVSAGLHGVIAILLLLAVCGAVGLPGFVKADPFARVRGWDVLGREVASRIEGHGYTAILADDRLIAASLKYYLPERDVPVVVWGRIGPPQNHYELTAMIGRDTGRHVFYVTTAGRPEGIVSRFDGVQDEGEWAVRTGSRRILRFNFYALDGFKGF